MSHARRYGTSNPQNQATHSPGSAELSRRKSSSKPFIDKNTRTVSDYGSYIEDDDDDDDDAVPSHFDRHLFYGAGLDEQSSTKPLIDYCTNAWKEMPYDKGYRHPLDEEFEDETEEWYDFCLDCLRSRKARRWTLLITSLFILILYLSSTTWSRLAEERMLTESLRLRNEAETRKLFGGVFGNSMRPSFSDMIHIKTMDQHFLPGKHASKDSGRLVFVGDIHGCKEELQALLKKVQFDAKKDHLVTTGDMIAKGSDSRGTVDLLRAIGASCVRGNNEDRILLLAKALDSTRLRQNGGGKARDNDTMNNPSNPLSKWPDESLGAELDADQISYLQSCPVILKVGHIDAVQGDVVVVHAGLVPGVPLKNQDPSSVMTMRTIDVHSHVPSMDGKEGPVKKNHKSAVETPKERWPGRKPPYNVHWVKLWNHFQKSLPESKTGQAEERVVVVYGHDSKRGLQVRKWSIGLDSGCVGGGSLTALVVGDGGKREDLVSVKCRDYSPGA